MGHLRLETDHISSPLRAAFAISRGSKTSAETVRVRLSEDGNAGRGESVPYGRYGETVQSVLEEIDAVRVQIEAGITREALQSLMKPGAARCAVDCALWDLEAKKTGKPVWQLAGLPEPAPVETALTISLDTPDAMAAAATAAPGRLLKLKLGGAEDLARIKAVHEARPEARLIADANEGLSEADLPGLVKAAARLGVVLIEQPFPAGKDAALMRRPGAVAICADESAHTSADIQTLARNYDAVNVKLDKAGGLTEALAMVRAARTAGMGVMVGCMVAGSLSMAPAVLLAQLADAADLDGPLWLASDIEGGLVYAEGRVSPPGAGLWGWGGSR
ncbi:mandelate racemase/muconate lactonizing enzyme family protein [Hyphomonas neptunium ATCC 15444]|uniref:Dipeptide epimerase n=2 Tax=Hyphomonas TaxID=85 RepID=Q0BY43_HYPNA|nr:MULTISPECIES: N-acetyl-D-Glu racemase DgcA [Hyphomonas]ABI76070.1 mandelate racemase/muconate lactonizing enzyme family protein [Hyphomonas neptunium ATCC 15444]KCZ88830.1 mandelate racemase/muconate lactonizing enzyme family protein [Hyphomonas hirschiana VP5]